MIFNRQDAGKIFSQAWDLLIAFKSSLTWKGRDKIIYALVFAICTLTIISISPGNCAMTCITSMFPVIQKLIKMITASSESLSHDSFWFVVNSPASNSPESVVGIQVCGLKSRWFRPNRPCQTFTPCPLWVPRDQRPCCACMLTLQTGDWSEYHSQFSVSK